MTLLYKTGEAPMVGDIIDILTEGTDTQRRRVSAIVAEGLVQFRPGFKLGEHLKTEKPSRCFLVKRPRVYASGELPCVGDVIMVGESGSHVTVFKVSGHIVWYRHSHGKYPVNSSRCTLIERGPGNPPVRQVSNNMPFTPINILWTGEGFYVSKDNDYEWGLETDGTWSKIKTKRHYLPTREEITAFAMGHAVIPFDYLYESVVLADAAKAIRLANSCLEIKTFLTIDRLIREGKRDEAIVFALRMPCSAIQPFALKRAKTHIPS